MVKNGLKWLEVAKNDLTQTQLAFPLHLFGSGKLKPAQVGLLETLAGLCPVKNRVHQVTGTKEIQDQSEKFYVFVLTYCVNNIFTETKQKISEYCQQDSEKLVAWVGMVGQGWDAARKFIYFQTIFPLNYIKHINIQMSSVSNFR